MYNIYKHFCRGITLKINKILLLEKKKITFILCINSSTAPSYFVLLRSNGCSTMDCSEFYTKTGITIKIDKK